MAKEERKNSTSLFLCSKPVLHRHSVASPLRVKSTTNAGENVVKQEILYTLVGM
jgi:hypothetical protein